MNNLPINEIVKQILNEQRKTPVDLGRAIGLSNDGAYKLLKRDDWKISELENVGAFLKRNLFEEFVTRQSKEEELSAQLKVKEAELTELKNKFAFMEQENKYLKELVEMAKMKLKK